MVKVLSVVVVFTLAVQGPGCSWSFMERVPDDYRRDQEPGCSGENMPYLDTTLSAVYLLLAVVGTVILASPGSSKCSDDSFCIVSSYDIMTVVTPVTGVLGILHGISAWSGYCWAEDCEKATKAHNRWQRLTPEMKRKFEEQWRKGKRY